jgi:Leucine-rich repeat (LRR) protein
MAQIFTWPGVHALELANNKLTSLPDWVANATNITEINLEHNALTEIPSALPPHLTTLRLAGNPFLTTDAQLNPTVTLMQTLSEQTALTTLSVGFSPAGLPHPGFLVEAMPGMQAGIARCPGTLDRRVQAHCPFVIQT